MNILFDENLNQIGGLGRLALGVAKRHQRAARLVKGFSTGTVWLQAQKNRAWFARFKQAILEAAAGGSFTA